MNFQFFTTFQLVLLKAANETFLTSLMMIECHDMIADQAAAQYNVTWSRTTPIIVSVFDDAYRTVMTLECDHRFGMDVTGDPNNVTAFRYACSSAINPLEHYVMKTLFPGGNGTSIVMGLGMELFNGQMPGIFISNGYLIMRSTDNNLFLIFDPETGILRDIMLLNSTVSGAGCFSDMQTEWIYKVGEDILFNLSSATMMNINAIGDIALNFGGYLSEFAANIPGLFNAYIPEVVAAVLAASVYVPPVFCIVGGAVVGYVIFQYCVDQGWLPSERCREIAGTAFPIPFGAINMFVYGEGPKIPTWEELKETVKEADDLSNGKIEEQWPGDGGPLKALGIIVMLTVADVFQNVTFNNSNNTSETQSTITTTDNTTYLIIKLRINNTSIMTKSGT